MLYIVIALSMRLLGAFWWQAFAVAFGLTVLMDIEEAVREMRK